MQPLRVTAGALIAVVSLVGCNVGRDTDRVNNQISRILYDMKQAKPVPIEGARQSPSEQVHEICHARASKARSEESELGKLNLPRPGTIYYKLEAANLRLRTVNRFRSERRGCYAEYGWKLVDPESQ